jgi:hypothetical protein
MSVRSGQSITVLFTTRSFSTGAGANASSTPTGTLYVNGVSNAATVTVANLSTGVYTAQVTLPTLNIGDEITIAIAATVSGVTDTATIWGDTKDFAIDSSGDVTFNNTSIATVATTTNLTNLPSIPNNWLTAAGIASGALDGKGDWLLSATYTAPNNAGITSIVNKLPTNNIADETLVVAATTSILAAVDAIPTAAAPTAVQNADALLGRNVAGGSSSGRTVSESLFLLRNKWTSISGVLTVYSTDDLTVSWAANLTGTSGANPVTASAPTS